MKRSELLLVIAVTLLSAILFVSSGRLIWAAPTQTPDSQTVPPRPTPTEPPAPPEEPTSEPSPPPVDEPPSQGDEDDDGSGAGAADVPSEELVTATNTPTSPPQEPPTETIATPETVVTDQKTEAGTIPKPDEPVSTGETAIEGAPPDPVEEPAEPAEGIGSTDRPQNVAFDERVSEIAAEASAEAPAERVVLAEPAGFPLIWLIALGAGLGLIIAGVIIIKRA